MVSLEPPRGIGLVEEGNWRKAKQEVPADHATKGLDDTYVIEDRHLVAPFIEDHRLRGLLLHALAPLNAVFGEKTLKTLKLVRDDEGFEALFCLVMTTGEMESERQALRRFDEQWWLAHTRQAQGKLNFDFELI